ncbi:MAG: hypothetical protein KatS3mg011_1446 [Acidimicrobiia bacterium]|nr:MAG: hypothetical protein KatS3mg011_1446 [Acidimicrobiia bacterium]
MLPRLRDLYRPFESLVLLRIPAQGRGGFDFYFNGQVTNRSDSFFEHRAAIHRVVALYRQATDASERVLWLQADDDQAHFNGAALTFRFSDELSQATFDRWIESTFTRRGRFRLAGRRFPISPTRVQVAAIDRHLWQPLQMEFSTRGIVALLPRGTCGNTVHRLATNIQRFLDPGVKVWLGGADYTTVIKSSISETA